MKVIIDIPDSALPDDQRWGIVAAKYIRKVAEHVEYCREKGTVIPGGDGLGRQEDLAKYQIEPSPYSG